MGWGTYQIFVIGVGSSEKIVWANVLQKICVLPKIILFKP